MHACVVFRALAGGASAERYHVFVVVDREVWMVREGRGMAWGLHCRQNRATYGMAADSG